jgi:hypothetical protein
VLFRVLNDAFKLILHCRKVISKREFRQDALPRSVQLAVHHLTASWKRMEFKRKQDNMLVCKALIRISEPEAEILHASLEAGILSSP